MILQPFSFVKGGFGGLRPITESLKAAFLGEIGLIAYLVVFDCAECIACSKTPIFPCKCGCPERQLWNVAGFVKPDIKKPEGGCLSGESLLFSMAGSDAGLDPSNDFIFVNTVAFW